MRQFFDIQATQLRKSFSEDSFGLANGYVEINRLPVNRIPPHSALNMQDLKERKTTKDQTARIRHYPV